MKDRCASELVSKQHQTAQTQPEDRTKWRRIESSLNNSDQKRQSDFYKQIKTNSVQNISNGFFNHIRFCITNKRICTKRMRAHGWWVGVVVVGVCLYLQINDERMKNARKDKKKKKKM